MPPHASKPKPRRKPASNRAPAPESPPDDETALAVVGVGASAGGLNAFIRLLSHLPTDTGMAFVLIQHLDPRHKSMLTELLARECPLPIREVADGMPMQADHVYVIPPNQQLTVLHNRLHFMPPSDGGRRYNPVDIFFQSLAEDRGSKAIGVILSGTASDGTLGSRAIKQAGGITFAQDRASAEYDGMPSSATAAGCVDFVLTPEDIARELGRIARHPMLRSGTTAHAGEDILAASEEQLGKIFILLRSRTGHDFSYYKSTTIKRRITRRMLVHRVDQVAQYIQLLQRDPSEADALFHDILINVTSFFRDPETFDALRLVAFPKILEHHAPDLPVRIWVPGCASGQEVYSIAIALHEFLGTKAANTAVQIFGSDIDELAIDKARSGIYPESIADEISPVRLKRYFQKVAGGYQVNRLLRDMCVFAVQNVAKDPPFSRLDLVSCRNLLIYLGSILQKKVLQVFHYALQPNGLLLLGTSETIGSQVELFSLLDKKAKLYQKKSVALRLGDDFLFRNDRVPVPAGAPHPPEGAQVTIYDLAKEAERILLQRYAPPGVIVGPDQNVERFLGRTWPYIEPSAGAASLNLYKIAHPDLVVELRAAIHTVTRDGGEVRKDNVRIRTGGGEQRVDIQVLPLAGSVVSESNLLVMFEPRPVPISTDTLPAGDTDATDALRERNAEVERELGSTREYMQSIIEEQEGTNEELRSANEEIQSTNEELQSTNEELETAKEELQSANEELATVNEELENRNQELARTNNDLTNLLISVNLPILMLGADLCIRKFTQPAERLLNLIGTDLGRPIGNIKPNIDIPNLELEVLKVIDTMSTTVLEAQDSQGHWFSISIRPYKTLDNHIDGAVITFINIDQIRDIAQMQDTLAEERRLATVVRDSSDAITVQDLDGNILAWNPAAARLYGYAEAEAVGMNVRTTVAAADQAQWEHLQQELRAGHKAGPIELERIHKDGHRLRVWLIASALPTPHGKPAILATTEREL